MKLSMLLLLITGGPLMPNCHYEHVDCIEVNHVHDRKGRFMFSQVVLWKIEASDGKLHNHGWKHVKNWMDQAYSYRGNWCVQHESERGRLFVTAPCYRERSTHDDVERLDTKEFWKGQAPNLFLMEKEKVENE